MTKLPRDIKGKQIIRALKREGWEIIRSKGSHFQLAHDDHDFSITVPCHPFPVKIKVLHSIITATGLSVDEFIDLL